MFRADRSHGVGDDKFRAEAAKGSDALIRYINLAESFALTSLLRGSIVAVENIHRTDAVAFENCLPHRILMVARVECCG